MKVNKSNERFKIIKFNEDNNNFIVQNSNSNEEKNTFKNNVTQNIIFR